MEKKKEVYQRQSMATCAYIHNSKRGDKEGKVHPVIAFEELPGGWCCPGYGAKKDKFKCLDE